MVDGIPRPHADALRRPPSVAAPAPLGRTVPAPPGLALRRPAPPATPRYNSPHFPTARQSLTAPPGHTSTKTSPPTATESLSSRVKSATVQFQRSGCMNIAHRHNRCLYHSPFAEIARYHKSRAQKGTPEATSGLVVLPASARQTRKHLIINELGI